MSAALEIVDQTASGKPLRKFTLELVSGTVTVRELIRERVRHEVQAYNAHRGEIYEGLVQPAETELALNGYRMRRRRALDVEREYETALSAFSRNGFFLLLDDRQVDSLDEEILVTPKTQVTFVRLVPLAGG